MASTIVTISEFRGCPMAKATTRGAGFKRTATADTIATSQKKGGCAAGHKQIWIGHCSFVKTPAFYHTAVLAGLAVNMTWQALASSKPPSSTVPKKNTTSQRLLEAA
ncbi:hypothetical protein MRX96_042146 [Rhipicephalus microplus]